MRTYGRVTDLYGNKTWVEVSTDAQGSNDYVYVTTLIQCLKLNLGESPFFANYGIPSVPSLISQVFPDYYVQQLQQQFAPYFASLIINNIQAVDGAGVPYPAYQINIVTHQGVPIAAQVPQ